MQFPKRDYLNIVELIIFVGVELKAKMTHLSQGMKKQITHYEYTLKF